MIFPVILAGGSGTRLWPLSRKRFPKQLLKLGSDRTMLQETLHRLTHIAEMGKPVVICSEDYRFMVADQLRTLGVDNGTIVLEPMGRNTAPAVAVAAELISREDKEGVLLVLPADHFIADRAAFQKAVETAASAARSGYLLTFGIIPDAPETGYGYIRKGAPLKGADGEHPLVRIERFVEKPDLETAVGYVTSGAYCWNSGMFVFQAAAILSEMQRWVPEMVAACRRAVAEGTTDLDFFRLGRAAFEACPADSIDYAVMEKTDRGAMIPLAAGWNDIGSWEALYQVGARDDAENVIQGDVLIHDVHRSFLHAESRLLAAVGLESHIVVETADAVLISPRDRVQDVKILVNALSDRGREETVSHKTAYSPWGISETLVRSERFRVNRVTVKPGAVMSFQKHFNRSEHWIVVRGTARVIRGDQEIILGEDRSTYIPPGVAHQISNPGRIPLEVIEVQTGSYLGEDDIVRLPDTGSMSRSNGIKALEHPVEKPVEPGLGGPELDG